MFNCPLYLLLEDIIHFGSRSHVTETWQFALKTYTVLSPEGDNVMRNYQKSELKRTEGQAAVLLVSWQPTSPSLRNFH